MLHRCSQEQESSEFEGGIDQPTLESSDRTMSTYTRRTLLAAGGVATAVALAGCSTSDDGATEGTNGGDDGGAEPTDGTDDEGTEATDGALAIGSKRFTENVLLSTLSAVQLETEAGIDRVETDHVGARTTLESFQYLSHGQFDHYWEYTGTLARYHYADERPETLADVRELAAEDGIAVLEPGAFNNTYEMVTTDAWAADNDVTSLSDLLALIEAGDDVQVALGDEYVGRDDGWQGLTAAYGLDEERRRAFNEHAVEVVEAGATYDLLAAGEVDLSMGFSTDPALGDDELVALEDDLEFFPTYNPVALVARSSLDDHPEIEPALNELAGTLESVERMRDLNGRVDEDGEEPRDVAREYVDAEL